jgi:hypothetical protein
MGFDVDEAWRHRKAVGIYDLLGISRNCSAERCDPAVGNCKITNDTLAATPVDDEPTANGERTLYALA